MAAVRQSLPFATSVSGGVSLGAYQAGLLYYEVQTLRTNREFIKPWVVTGSSAGAINALISIIEHCEESSRTADDSLFWKSWQGVGFAQLTARNETQSPVALFSRQALIDAATLIEARWRKGLPKSCDVVFGVTSTLQNPEALNLSEGISIQRQTIPFVMRIQGRGPGLSPLIDNYVNRDNRSLKLKLYFDSDPENRFHQLKQLLLASAAFPMAFEPVKLRICRGSEERCTLEKSEERDFIDGGILENQPLRLALRIVDSALTRDASGRNYLFEEPQAGGNREAPSSRLHFHHVDTDARAYPSPDLLQGSSSEEGFIPYLVKFGMNFISTARTRELYSLIEDHPDFKNQLTSTLAYFPRASDPWAAFFGFFDRGFREFDFLLGISEARRGLEPVVKRQGWNLPAIGTSLDPEIQQHLDCISAWMNPDGFQTADVPDFCSSSANRNMAALAQAMWARLAEGCLQKDPSEHERSVYRSCRTIWAGKGPPIVRPEFASLPWKRENADTDEGIHLIQLLERYGYAFDPNEFPKSSGSPEMVMNRNLRKAIVALANRQQGAEQGAIRAAGDVILNRIQYLAPSRIFYLTVGESSELAYLTRNFHLFELPDSMRVGFVLQSFRFMDLFKSDQGYHSVTPMLSGEWDLAEFRHGAYGLKGALRAGYLFAAHDRWGARSCRRTTDDFLDLCSGWSVQPALALTFLDRIRFQLVYRSVQPDRGGTSRGEIGFQLGFQNIF